MKKADRQKKIAALVPFIQQRAQVAKGGSVCLVPSTSEAGVIYRVDVDADYKPVACQCKGGKYECMHKEAVRLFFAPRLARLLDSTINPVYLFRRAGDLIEARLSQFSAAEKTALREQQEADAKALAEEAARRDLYNFLFDPNGVDAAMYA